MSSSNPAMEQLVYVHKPIRQQQFRVECTRPRVALVIDHNGKVLLWKDAPYYRGRGRGKGKRTV